MKKVSVSAERDYTVSIGSPWVDSLVPLIQSRTRVAVIVSSGFSPQLTITAAKRNATIICLIFIINGFELINTNI